MPTTNEGNEFKKRFQKFREENINSELNLISTLSDILLEHNSELYHDHAFKIILEHIKEHVNTTLKKIEELKKHKEDLKNY